MMAPRSRRFSTSCATIDRSSPNWVSPEDRIAVFDQDGTLRVEQPIYTQFVYCLERVPAVAVQKPSHGGPAENAGAAR
jgi:hypothetical protein